MNVVLDFGNTRIKLGCFDGETLLNCTIYDHWDVLIASLTQLKPNHIMICSVVELTALQLSIINKMAPTILFLHNTPIPIINLYKSASTLGSDRLAAAIGANFLMPNKNILVIDAGTCIKYNFVTKNNEYLGGGISPGLQMRFKALQHFTDKLPLISFDANYNQLIGTDTSESIKMGVQIGLMAEVKEIITQYISNFSDINIVLTGGDASILQKGLKNNIFADPNLILKGLNRILNYQLAKK
jgi:type III pantothenate kinase